MVLSKLLAGWASRRPHVLLVAVPGAIPLRLAVETWCRDHGGVLVGTPSDADLLVVAGQATGDFASAVAELWRQMPGPRGRVDVDTLESVRDRLDAACERLSARTPQPRADEWQAGADSGDGHEHGDHPHAMSADDDSDTDDPRHEIEHDRASAHAVHDTEHGEPDAHMGYDTEGIEHGHTSGHEGHMSHDMGDMEMPAGLMMADRAEDRDGLKLDVLPVALGPVLAYWPTGLVVDAVLQGDVVQRAIVRGWQEPEADGSFWPRHPVASRLDRAADLFGVLGWEAAAVRARILRDQVLNGGPDEYVTGVANLARRAERSVLVRSGLRGLAPVDGADAYARLLGWLSATDEHVPYAANVDATCDLMVGHDLATARLVMASLPPDLSAVAAEENRGAGGGR